MEDLSELASQPKRAKTPLGEVENHSLSEQIKLDEYNSKKTLKNGFRVGRIFGSPSGPRGS